LKEKEVKGGRPESGGGGSKLGFRDGGENVPMELEKAKNNGGEPGP